MNSITSVFWLLLIAMFFKSKTEHLFPFYRIHCVRFYCFKMFHLITGYINFVHLRYLRLKLLKYKENYKKICDTFDCNYPLYYNELGIIGMIGKALFCTIYTVRWCPYSNMTKNGA